MPELPEVETVRRGLNTYIVGKKIAQVREHDSPKSFPNAPEQVAAFMYGARIANVRRRAKLLLIDLSSGYTLAVHLKMTGQLVYVGSRDERFGAGHPNESLIGALPDASTRVSLGFSGGGWLYFNDQRKFGWMQLLPTAQVPELPFMRTVGPEPLEDNFTPEQFAARFARRARTSIKAALLDQTVVAGIGNIYADESLWRAGIDPRRKVGSLTPQELMQLYHAVRECMNLSIAKGGSTDKNYVNAEGGRGQYLDHAWVFRRDGQPCPRCSHDIIKIKHAGRGTHLCPQCQV